MTFGAFVAVLAVAAVAAAVIVIGVPRLFLAHVWRRSDADNSTAPLLPTTMTMPRADASTRVDATVATLAPPAAVQHTFQRRPAGFGYGGPESRSLQSFL